MILVDHEDADLLCTGVLYYNDNGYVIIKGPTRLHIAVAARIGMVAVKPFVIDHKDGDRSNNSRSNLRVLHNTDNTRCRHVIGINNTSGFAGVSYVKYSRGVLAKPWIAQIKVSGRKIKLGYYTTKEEAASAYATVAEYVFKEYAPTVLMPMFDRVPSASVHGLACYNRAVSCE